MGQNERFTTDKFFSEHQIRITCSRLFLKKSQRKTFSSREKSSFLRHFPTQSKLRNFFRLDSSRRDQIVHNGIQFSRSVLKNTLKNFITGTTLNFAMDLSFPRMLGFLLGKLENYLHKKH